MNTGRFLRNRALVAALLMTPFAAVAFSETDRALFQEAAMPGVSSEVKGRASTLAHRLASERDMAALDSLIELNDLFLLRGYTGGWSGKNATPEFEARVLRHFGDREIAAILIPALYQYRSPDLFEALYRDARSLATWRADRRRKCRAQIAEYRPPTQALSGRAAVAVQAAPATQAGGQPMMRMPRQTRTAFLPGAGVISWNYVCDSRAEDDPRTDLDGRPPAAWSGPNREWASAEAVARTALPGVEARLAVLFRDLSLFPAVDWSRAGGEPDGVHFTTARPPLSFLQLFRDRRYGPEAGGLIDVLKEIIPNDHGTTTDKDAWWAIWALHGALAASDSPDATRQLVADIDRASAIENAEDRRFFLTWLIPLLGPVLPAAQADFAGLKGKVLDRLPRERVAEFTLLFARVEAENRSLREPTAESLTRWIDQPQYARFVPYLLAHGADPNGPRAQHLQPPLVMAAYSNPAAATMLLEAGADVNIRGLDGQTPLYAACDSSYGKPERAELAAVLIARGANVNADSASGQTPLHRAASGSPRCVRLLLAAGARAEAADGLGRTPLESAASNNNVETAKLLLDAGADPNRENKDGGSAYAAAYDRKPEVKALLEARGGRLSARQVANRARVKLLIELYRH